MRYDEKRDLWVASLSLGYHADGRRNRPVAYGKTKGEAMVELDRLRRENAAGRHADAARLTVGELLDVWLEARKGHLAEHTQEQRADAAVSVRAILGGVTASRLTSLAVTRFHQQMAREGVSPSGCYHAARTLRGCLEYAVGLGVLPANPARAAGLPALPQKEMIVLSQLQARALLAASAGYVAGPLVAVALGTGLRQGEQLGLTAADVSLEDATLTVRRQLTYTRTSGFALRKLKTRAARRTITLPPFALDALRERLEGLPPSRTIFSGPGGSHRHRGQLSAHLKKAIARANGQGAGIPEGFHWHGLRHTHASLLLSAGHSIRAVSARLGHSSAAFTLATYAWLLPGDDERLAAGVQSMLG